MKATSNATATINFNVCFAGLITWFCVPGNMCCILNLFEHFFRHTRQIVFQYTFSAKKIHALHTIDRKCLFNSICCYRGCLYIKLRKIVTENPVWLSVNKSVKHFFLRLWFRCSSLYCKCKFTILRKVASKHIATCPTIYVFTDICLKYLHSLLIKSNRKQKYGQNWNQFNRKIKQITAAVVFNIHDWLFGGFLIVILRFNNSNSDNQYSIK